MRWGIRLEAEAEQGRILVEEPASAGRGAAELKSVGVGLLPDDAEDVSRAP